MNRPMLSENPVQIGRAQLWLGDCRDILPTLPRVDAVVTDPPYGQGYIAPQATAKHGGLAAPPPKARSTVDRVLGDDAPFDPGHLLIASEHIIWGAHRFHHLLPAGGWLVWDKKPDGTRDLYGDGEAAWIDRRQSLRIYRHLWHGVRVQSGSAEAARQHGTGAQVSRVHPTQKPEAVMRWCLSFIRGRVILDPYMGSGTTGVAALQMGCEFIGIEIDAAHFTTACKRIEDAQRQPDLFVGEAA